jgi:hypothetical protein
MAPLGSNSWTDGGLDFTNEYGFLIDGSVQRTRDCSD